MSGGMVDKAITEEVEGGGGEEEKEEEAGDTSSRRGMLAKAITEEVEGVGKERKGRLMSPALTFHRRPRMKMTVRHPSQVF